MFFTHAGLLKREAEREKFSEYFGGAPVFSIPGSIHQPQIMHKPESHGRVENYLEEAVGIIRGINQKTNFPKGELSDLSFYFIGLVDS